MSERRLSVWDSVVEKKCCQIPSKEMNSSMIPILSIHVLNPNDKHSEQLIKTDTKKALQVTHMPPDPGKTYPSGFSQVAGRDNIHTPLAERCKYHTVP